MSNKYEEVLKEYKSKTGDKNACTVMALSMVTGLDPVACNKHMSDHGRVPGRGMLLSEIDRALSNMKGFKFKKGPYSKTKRVTVNQFIKKHTEGRYYVVMRGHAFAVVDGEVMDHSPRFRHQIKAAYRCYTDQEIKEIRNKGKV